MEVRQLQASLAQRDAELQKARSAARSRQTATSSSAPAVGTTTANPVSAQKPRVFVRHGEKAESVSSASADSVNAGFANPVSASASAENLAGTQMPAQRPASAQTNARRALYTRDGYRLKRTDGLDDLALLPGLNLDLAESLRANNVTEFCLLYTSPSPRDGLLSRMPSSA